LTAPIFKVVGTRHVMCVSFHKTYLEGRLGPNATMLEPRFAPKPLPMIVTSWTPTPDRCGDLLAGSTVT
jgi:hypothetical protein